VKPAKYEKQWKKKLGSAEESSVWAEVDSLVKPVQIDTVGFTLREFRERYHMARTTAQERINNLVDAGKLVEGVGLRKGRRFKTYRPA